VGIHAIHHERLHLERLRTAAIGDRVAALDVGEPKAVGLVLAIDLVEKLLAQLLARERPARGDDEVALARDRLVAGLAPTVAVAAQERPHRRAIEQEALELATLHEHRAA